MGKIKSAAEIAMEKLAVIGEPTEAERLQWKVGPEGEKLAARFLKEDINLKEAVAAFDEKSREIVTAGINDILDILMPMITVPTTIGNTTLSRKVVFLRMGK